jgi:hypothetical protein
MKREAEDQSNVGRHVQKRFLSAVGILHGTVGRMITKKRKSESGLLNLLTFREERSPTSY